MCFINSDLISTCLLIWTWHRWYLSALCVRVTVICMSFSLSLLWVLSWRRHAGRGDSTEGKRCCSGNIKGMRDQSSQQADLAEHTYTHTLILYIQQQERHPKWSLKSTHSICTLHEVNIPWPYSLCPPLLPLLLHNSFVLQDRTALWRWAVETLNGAKLLKMFSCLSARNTLLCAFTHSLQSHCSPRHVYTPHTHPLIPSSCKEWVKWLTN